MSPNFLTLPFEVRYEIYSHVFDYDSIWPHVGSDGRRLLFHGQRRPKYIDSYYALFDPKSLLALLEVNHAISDEAAAYFYGNIGFNGTWHAIAAFIKGIGARRRDLIRNVKIFAPTSQGFQFDKDDTLELLGALPKLRTARITASVPDFMRLQNQLIQGGISEIAGRFDICVHNTCGGMTLSCAKDTIQWTGSKLNQTLLPPFDLTSLGHH